MQINTQRLHIRAFGLDDSEFLLGLMSEPSYIQNIGDRNLKTISDATQFIEHKMFSSYQKYGFGMYVVEHVDLGQPIGICGLIKRPELNYPDLGYAFMPAYWGRGYCSEAGQAILQYARKNLGLRRIQGIVKCDNSASINVLKRLGYVNIGHIDYDDTDNYLFQVDLY